MAFVKMPTLMSDLIIDTDSEDEDEDETLPKTPPTPTATLPNILFHSLKATILITPNCRPIAGSKRVLQFRGTYGSHSSREGEEILQSITASPALGHKSFEELRMECYMQSQLATGSPPKAVDPGMTPWAVIPPAFNAFHVQLPWQSACADAEPGDVVMSG